MVMMSWLKPPEAAKFIAVAMVPGPAKIGVASGDIAKPRAAFFCAFISISLDSG